MTNQDREIQTTKNWGLAILGAILVPTIGGFIWVGGLENRVSNNEAKIAEVRNEVRSVQNDIRDILVGIEQIKGRLGIIETQQ